MSLNIAADEMNTLVADQAVAPTRGSGLNHGRRQPRIPRRSPEPVFAAGMTRLSEHVDLLGLRVVLAGKVVSLDEGGARPFLKAAKEIRREGVQDMVHRVAHGVVTFEDRL